MKISNILLDQWRDEILKDVDGERKSIVHHFYCMAHVLLGFHRYSVANLKGKQSAIIASDGKFGRDKLERFKFWRQEFCGERTVRMVSEIFGPVGDYLGLRDVWEAHCAEHGIKSRIGQYKDNRFNCLFETSAQVLHHLEEFRFLLKGVAKPNQKLVSIAADLDCPVVLTFIQALAVMFVRVTGPYWNLVEEGAVPYMELSKYVKPLYAHLQVCIKDPKLILSAPVQILAPFFDTNWNIFSHCLNPLFDSQRNLLHSCIGMICEGLSKTIEMQLKDFLPGGKYESQQSEDSIKRTSFAHLTNLACEHHFGDLDASQRRRPNCSLHHHSTLQILKRNRKAVNEWYSTMDTASRKSLWADAKKHGKAIRIQHKAEEKEEVEKLKGIFQDAKLKSQRKKRGADCLSESDPAVPKEDLLPVHPTLKTDQWVAVAYEDNWYPG